MYESLPPCGRTYQTIFWCYGFKSSSWYWIRIPRYWIFHLVKKMEILLEEVSRGNIIKWKCIALLPLHLQSKVHFIGAFMVSFSQMESRCIGDKKVISATCLFRKWNHGASKIKRWYQPRWFLCRFTTQNAVIKRCPFSKEKTFFFFNENIKQWYFFLLNLGLKSFPLLRRKYRRIAQNS